MTTVSGSTARAGSGHGSATLPFWQLLASGALTALFGLAVLAWPQGTLRLMGILAGVWLLAIGLTRVFGMFRRAPGTDHRLTLNHIVDGAFGALLIVVGVLCLREVVAGVLAVAVLLGLAWLLSGFVALLLGLFAQGVTRTWLLIIGGVSIGIGVLFLAWPGLSLHALVLLTGIAAVAIGAAEMVVAFQTRHETHKT